MRPPMTAGPIARHASCRRAASSRRCAEGTAAASITRSSGRAERRIWDMRAVYSEGREIDPMAHEAHLLNYVGGTWQRSHARDHLHVTNPATGVALAEVPLSPVEEVDAAVSAAAAAWPGWRRVPATERIQYLFKLK